jgi:hypothetical protein
MSIVSGSVPSDMHYYSGATFGIAAESIGSLKRRRCDPSSPWYVTFGAPNFNNHVDKDAEEPNNESEEVIQAIELGLQQRKRRLLNRRDEATATLSKNADFLKSLKEERERELAIQTSVYKEIIGSVK